MTINLLRNCKLPAASTTSAQCRSNSTLLETVSRLWRRNRVDHLVIWYSIAKLEKEMASHKARGRSSILNKSRKRAPYTSPELEFHWECLRCNHAMCQAPKILPQLIVCSLGISKRRGHNAITKETLLLACSP